MTHEINQDDLWPRDAAHRFRIYAVAGDEMEVLCATPTAEGIGTALYTLHEDQKAVGRRLADKGRIGVLDVMNDGPHGDWVLLPWSRREALDRALHREFPNPESDEIRTIYNESSERYVVTLIASYDADSPRQAAAALLDLTRDMGSDGTQWHVYDRATGEMHMIEQGDFEETEVP